MPNVATKLEDLIAARYLHRGDIPHKRKKENNWSRDTLAGRLVEIRSATAPARLTAAFGVVRNAQEHGESAVWITTTHSSFFPPDAAEGGVYLDSMPVVRLPLVNLSCLGVPEPSDQDARDGRIPSHAQSLVGRGKMHGTAK